MKHIFLKTGICLLLLASLLFTACQKQIDIPFEEPVLKENFVTEAKAWFTNGPVLTEKKILDFPISILPENAPKRLFARMGKIQKKLEWQNAEFYNREGVKYLVVPITTALKKYGNEYEIAKSLVFYKDRIGVMKVNVVEVLSKKGTSLQRQSNSIIATAFFNKVKNEKEIIKGVNCNLFFYDEAYKNISNYEIDNGIWIESKTSLKINDKDSGNVNNAFSTNSSGQPCQTWYITYDWRNQEGELIAWILLGSYQTGDCGNGGNEEELPEGEGGGGEESPCNMSIEEADAILASINSSPVSDGGFQSGSETSPDANGIIRKPVVVHRHGVTNNYGLGYSENHQLFFNGMLFKTSSNSVYKWESLVFSQVMRTSGSTPPCITSDVTASVAGPVISNDGFSANFTAFVTTTVSIGCLGGARVGTNTVTVNGTYNASSF